MSGNSDQIPMEQSEGVDNSLLYFTINDKGFNLQDAFKQFRLSRKKELRRARSSSKKLSHARLQFMSQPENMWDLRMKFLAQIQKYMGVPYAKRYWKPEEPEFASNIFLDCCGLVRRAMWDLQEDFGFHLGPWNQAYMYDTLPITVQTEEEMQPGDLVFIAATYYDEKKKPQKHNITHVEIWLGDGPKSIGSRWHRGHVQIFDSYRFEPKAYHSEQYIFKSIDTWLMGICKSYCSTHKWIRRKRKRLVLPAKSIFLQEEDEDIKNASDSQSACDIKTTGSDISADIVLTTRSTPTLPVVKPFKTAGARSYAGDDFAVLQLKSVGIQVGATVWNASHARHQNSTVCFASRALNFNEAATQITTDTDTSAPFTEDEDTDSSIEACSDAEDDDGEDDDDAAGAGATGGCLWQQYGLISLVPRKKGMLHFEPPDDC